MGAYGRRMGGDVAVKHLGNYSLLAPGYDFKIFKDTSGLGFTRKSDWT